MEHVIASSEGAWQSKGCGVYSEQQNRDCAACSERSEESRFSIRLYSSFLLWKSSISALAIINNASVKKTTINNLDLVQKLIILLDKVVILIS